MTSLALALSIAGCGGASAAPRTHASAEDAASVGPGGGPTGPSGPASEVTGFGSTGLVAAARPTGSHGATDRRDLAVTGEVGGRAVRLGAAFLLTPDVEGPVELHAFEGDVTRESVCPGGLADHAPGVELRVMLPDTRNADETSLATMLDGTTSVPLRGVRVRVSGTTAEGSIAVGSIDVEGADGSHLRGAMPVYVCPDPRAVDEE